MPKCAKCNANIEGDPEPYFIPEYEGEVCRQCFWAVVAVELAEHPIVAAKHLLGEKASSV